MRRHLWSDLQMWEEWLVYATMPDPIRPAGFRKALARADVEETRAICEVKELKAA